jgi:hypothetical protein
VGKKKNQKLGIRVISGIYNKRDKNGKNDG